MSSNGPVNREEALRTVLEKRSVLVALAAGEAEDLPGLVEATAYSRSTVNRTVNALEEMGLVRVHRSSSRHRYELTFLGRQLLAVVDGGHTLLEHRTLFEGIPADADLPPWIVADGSVSVVSDGESTPHRVFDQLYEVAGRADRLKIVAPVLTRDATFHSVADRVPTGELAVEMVFPQDHIDAIGQRFEAEIERMLTSGEATILSLGDRRVPYGFGINYVEDDDGAVTDRIVCIVCYDEGYQNANGTIVSDDPAAVAWAEAKYAAYREQAAPVQVV